MKYFWLLVITIHYVAYSTPSDAAVSTFPYVSRTSIANATKGEGARDSVAPPPGAALPEFPVRPEIDTGTYPDCREDYLAQGEPRARAVAINRCTEQLDQFYSTHMLPYREAMIAYQQRLAALYSEDGEGVPAMSAEKRQQYYRRMLGEHRASAPGGAHQAGYRAIEARYTTDRAYLADRYCFNTGCNGYSAPVTPKGSAKQRQSVRLGVGTEMIVPIGEGGDDKRRCGRGGAKAFGGLAGGIAGGASGLDGLGVVMSGLLGAVLAGEIACQLDDKERKAAADATLALTKRDKLGATAAWVSPTRQGVSGSSTITELGTQPNGTRCLSITDIAIIDGEETRIVKWMCRAKPGEPYRIMP